jgi:hypothetical protein
VETARESHFQFAPIAPSAPAPHECYRDSSQIQFTSQLWPPSAENDCSLARRDALLNWAAAEDAYIVEDDYSIRRRA